MDDLSKRVGCMACSSDYCIKCKFWEPEPEPPRGVTWWGICRYFTDNPGAPRRIYSGNIDLSMDEAKPIKTTDMAKCRNFEKG